MIAQIRPKTTLDIAAIQALIHYLLNRRPFMLGRSLALLYEVKPKQIMRAVKHNPKRFPDDFYFQLTDEEVDILKFQQNLKPKSVYGLRYLDIVHIPK